MSLVSLVGDDLRSDLAHLPLDRSSAEFGPERSADLQEGDKVEPDPDAKAKPVETPSSPALDALVKYIPTEVITLYLAAVSATTAIHTAFPALNGVFLYWAFAVLTPLLYFVLFVNGRIANKLSALPKYWSQLPWWNMVAATIAYLVWALAVPNNPFIQSDALAVIAGFCAIFVSLMLSLLGTPVNYLLDKLAPANQ